MSKRMSKSTTTPLKLNEIIFAFEPASKKARTAPQTEKNKKKQIVLIKKKVNKKIFIKDSFFDFKENEMENDISFIENSFKSIFSLLGKKKNY
jgi:hypothetical protein